MLKYISDVCNPSQMINPLFRMLGMEVKKVEKGRATMLLPLIPGFKQGGGVLAGGIMVTMADESMALAAMSASMELVVTSEINSRFLRSTIVDEGGFLRAEASVIRAGRTIVTAEAQIFDHKDRLLLIAGASFVIRAGGEKINNLCRFPKDKDGSCDNCKG